jgi:hypothetical protein
MVSQPAIRLQKFIKMQSSSDITPINNLSLQKIRKLLDSSQADQMSAGLKIKTSPKRNSPSPKYVLVAIFPSTQKK